MAANSSRDDTNIAIESSVKVELKPGSMANRASSPATMHPYFLKSYETSHRAAKLIRPPPAKKIAAEARDEIISELIGIHPTSTSLGYMPEANRITIGPPPVPEHAAADTVSIGSRESVPKPEARPLARPPIRVPRPKAPALNYPVVLYSISMNVLSFVILFLLLSLIMQIPGVTPVNSVSIFKDLRIEFLPIPLWFNTGCLMAAVIVIVGIILYHVKYALGLLIGLPVGFNTVLSLFMEGMVGNGIVFGFCISMVSLLCLIWVGKVSLTSKDTTFLSMVAGLSVIPVVGHIIHLFAALLIGPTVGMLAQIVLLSYVTLHRHR